MLDSFLPQSVTPLTPSRALPGSSGRCLRATSMASSVPFIPLRHPSARRLITRHSLPAPPSTFKVSLLPALLSIFGVGSLPIPRSASDCRRPDALRRSRTLRVPPSRCHPLPPYSTVSSCPDELRWRMCLAHVRRGRRAVVHRDTSRPLRSTRIALVCAVRAVGNWWGALGGTREHRKGAPEHVRRGRSVLAMMILEGANCLDVQ
jgi:hypothetical protein